MITNNFRKILTLIFSSNANGTYTPAIPTTNLPQFVNTGGTTTQMNSFEGYGNRLLFLYNMMNHMSKGIISESSIGTLHLKIGTGTTPPTVDDFELTELESRVSCDTVIVGNSANNTKTYTATFSNPLNTDITVAEVGLYGTIIYNGMTESFMEVLLDRTVLSTPITIPAGESKAITYELGF